MDSSEPEQSVEWNAHHSRLFLLWLESYCFRTVPLYNNWCSSNKHDISMNCLENFSPCINRCEHLYLYPLALFPLCLPDDFLEYALHSLFHKSSHSNFPIEYFMFVVIVPWTIQCTAIRYLCYKHFTFTNYVPQSLLFRLVTYLVFLRYIKLLSIEVYLIIHSFKLQFCSIRHMFNRLQCKMKSFNFICRSETCLAALLCHEICSLGLTLG